MKHLIACLALAFAGIAAAPDAMAFETFNGGIEAILLKLDAGAHAEAVRLCREALATDRQRQDDPGNKSFRMNDEQRLQIELMAAALDTGGAFEKMIVPRSGLPPKTVERVTLAAARALNAGGAHDAARYLAARREREVPRYNVTFLDEAPRSVAAWRASPLVGDPGLRETRFERYNREAAAALVYDVNLVRNADAQPVDDKPCPVSFFVAADPRAIYIYSETVDNRASDVFAGLADGGMYEMYIQPGFGESYYQWLLSLTDPPTRWCPVWGSPGTRYRLIDEHMTYEIAQIPGGIGLLTTLSWECFFDKLPKDSDEWALGFIPWIREGGFTWGSGQVHELHRFGRLTFKGIDRIMPEVRRWIVARAWSRYQKRAGPLKLFWNDEVRGDPDFARAVLNPLCEALDALGNGVATDMASERVERLFIEAVPRWHEIDLLVADERARYLKACLLRDE